MIPRHPGDPERLPKVSKRASGGWFRFGVVGALGRGASRCPKPSPAARPTGVGAAPAGSGGGRRGARGTAPSPFVFRLRGPLFLKEEKKGFSDGTYFGFCKGDINFLVMK